MVSLQFELNYAKILCELIDQLTEIKKNSLSTLLCNNFDIDTIQPDVFFTEATGIRSDIRYQITIFQDNFFMD